MILEYNQAKYYMNKSSLYRFDNNWKARELDKSIFLMENLKKCSF